MKKCKKIVAFLLLAVLTLIPLTGCADTKGENYMPCPIFTDTIYYAESSKSIGFVEYPYYTVYYPEESEGMIIEVKEDGTIQAIANGGGVYDENRMKFIEIMDGYKLIKLFDSLKAAHFYHYDKDTEKNIHKYYIDVVFDNADGSEERIYVNTDEYGYVTEIKAKDGKFRMELERVTE